MHEYSAKDLKKLFNLSAPLLKILEQDGHIRPSQGATTQYSFQELLVLRTASALRAAKIPARTIKKALEKLREALPESNLNALAVAPRGRRVAIRENSSLWEYDSGQYALPLGLEPQTKVTSLKPDQEPASAAAAMAEQHFAAAYALEEHDFTAARLAYEQCLACDPDHIEARINLGRLLYLAGDLTHALEVYGGAKRPNALLHFNMAIALEDLSRARESMHHYRQAIALDPAFADAHFNLARLHESAREPREALRHLLAYRRLLVRSSE